MGAGERAGNCGGAFQLPDTAVVGEDTARFSKSLDECQKLCLARSGCVGFDHSGKGECRLLARVDEGKRVPGSNAGTRRLIPNYDDPTNPPLAHRFEKLKETDMDGDELLALAKDAFDRGSHGIGWQAINLAVQRGNRDAKLEIARWYDPRTVASDRLDGPDANKAARAYFELALEGGTEAGTLLSSLCIEAGNSGSAYAHAFGGFRRTTYCEGSISP